MLQEKKFRYFKIDKNIQYCYAKFTTPLEGIY